MWTACFKTMPQRINVCLMSQLFDVVMYVKYLSLANKGASLCAFEISAYNLSVKSQS